MFRFLNDEHQHEKPVVRKAYADGDPRAVQSEVFKFINKTPRPEGNGGTHADGPDDEEADDTAKEQGRKTSNHNLKEAYRWAKAHAKAEEGKGGAGLQQQVDTAHKVPPAQPSTTTQHPEDAAEDGSVTLTAQRSGIEGERGAT